jgi:hypothetical protein
LEFLLVAAYKPTWTPMFPPKRLRSTSLSISLYGFTREEIAIVAESLQERAAGQEVTDTLTLDHET